MTAVKSLSVKDMNGLKIVNLASGTAPTDATTRQQLDAGVTAAESRANHTGTQIAATISDFDTAVRLNRIDQLTAPSNPVNLGNQRITSLADPTGAQDAASKAYVDAQLSGQAAGLQLKGSVRAAATANVNTAAPGANIDGIAASNGEVYLLAGQSTASQNGPWVFNGAASAMTRATNWDTNTEAVLGSYWIVREGTKADQLAILTNDSAVTVGTTALTFTFISATSTAVDGYSATCPAVSSGANWDVVHNLGTRLLIIQVFRSASPYDDVDVYWERLDVNTVRIQPDQALANGEFTAVVKKVV